MPAGPGRRRPLGDRRNRTVTRWGVAVRRRGLEAGGGPLQEHRPEHIGTLEQLGGGTVEADLALLHEVRGVGDREGHVHGLLDEDGCNSPFAIYAWWLALRLTFNTWWNSANSAAGQQEVNDDQAPAAEPMEEQGEP